MNRAAASAVLALCGTLLLASPGHAMGVVVTTEDVASIVREVLGPDGEVTTLASPHQDPHFVDARPSLLVPMSRADALVINGLELEVGWLPVLLKGSRNGDIQVGSAGYIDASQFIIPMEVPQGQVDRSMGDIHPRGNPHYLKDPHNAVLVARGLAEKFISIKPEKADAFRQRAAAFAAMLEERMKGWETRLAPLKGRGMISYHRSLNYLARWAGLEPVGTIEPKPGIPPSPAHIVQLITLARARKAQVFIQEAWFPTATPQVVAEKCSAKLVVVPGLPRANQKYVDHVDEVVNLFASTVTAPAP